MTHRIKSVKSLDNMKLSIVFQNGIEKEYDMRILYPVFPQFRELEDNRDLYERVQVDAGGYGISWNDELDLDAEEIWENGVTVATHVISVIDTLAESLIQARANVGMTQNSYLRLQEYIRRISVRSREDWLIRRCPRYRDWRRG